GPQVLGRREQARLAQAGGEPGRGLVLAGRLQPVVAAAVVGDEQLALRGGAEAGDLERRAGQLLGPGDPGALLAGAPSPGGGPDAVEVGAAQPRQGGAAVNDPSR